MHTVHDAASVEEIGAGVSVDGLAGAVLREAGNVGVGVGWDVTRDRICASSEAI